MLEFSSALWPQVLVRDALITLPKPGSNSGRRTAIHVWPLVCAVLATMCGRFALFVQAHGHTAGKVPCHLQPCNPCDMCCQPLTDKFTLWMSVLPLGLMFVVYAVGVRVVASSYRISGALPTIVTACAASTFCCLCLHWLITVCQSARAALGGTHVMVIHRLCANERASRASQIKPTASLPRFSHARPS